MERRPRGAPRAGGARDALPFLHRAKAVTIVGIRDDEAKGSVADELIRLAKAEGADLIVAGAYGTAASANGCSAG